MESASDEKLAELILYISAKCADDSLFGATKLNKVLYLCDFLAYGRFEKAITEAEYFKLPAGPGPRRLKPVRDELVGRRDLALKKVLMWNGRTQIRPVNLREPDLNQFSGNEIALVDEVISMLKRESAKDVSDRTHKMAGWNAVEMYETIPYSTILIAHAPLSPSEIFVGQKLAQEVAIAA